MSDYSWKEMMAVMFSREIKDTDKITSGAHTEIFFAATMLAQKTHAPNLKLQLGGSVTLCQVTDIDVPELPKTSTGYDLIRYAESVHDHPDTYLFYGAPGGKDYYKEGSEYRDVNHFWFADKFFVGGIQADKWGNTNMIGLAGKDGKMSFRGPGTIGINDIAVGVRDTYVFLTAHDKRRLVEKVDYISHPGKKVCRENEFYGGGPKFRSFRINFEITMWFTGDKMIADVEKMLKRDFADAVKVDGVIAGSQGALMRLLTQTARLLSPIL